MSNSLYLNVLKQCLIKQSKLYNQTDLKDYNCELYSVGTSLIDGQKFLIKSIYYGKDGKGHQVYVEFKYIFKDSNLDEIICLKKIDTICKETYKADNLQIYHEEFRELDEYLKIPNNYPKSPYGYPDEDSFDIYNWLSLDITHEDILPILKEAGYL